MKILVYKDNLSTGRGADKAVRNFAVGLAERGHDVALMEQAQFAEWLALGENAPKFDVLSLPIGAALVNDAAWKVVEAVNSWI